MRCYGQSWYDELVRCDDTLVLGFCFFPHRLVLIVLISVALVHVGIDFYFFFHLIVYLPYLSTFLQLAR